MILISMVPSGSTHEQFNLWDCTQNVLLLCCMAYTWSWRKEQSKSCPNVMSDQGTAESGAARPKYTSPGHNSWCNVSATTRPTCKAHAAELTCCTARELPSLCIAWQERAASSTAWCKTPRNQGPTKRRKTQGSQDFVYKCLQFTVLIRFTSIYESVNCKQFMFISIRLHKCIQIYQNVPSSSPLQHLPHLGCQAAGPSDSHGRQPAALTESRNEKVVGDLRRQFLQEQFDSGQRLWDKMITTNLDALESAVSARAISSHCNVKAKIDKSNALKSLQWIVCQLKSGLSTLETLSKYVRVQGFLDMSLLWLDVL